MARRKQNDTAERFTAFLGFYLPPALLAELKAVAVNQGATISILAREILFQGLGQTVPITVAHPDAETDAKIRSVTSATHAVNALGNLMNQIARHLHTTEDLGPFAADLREAIRTCEDVAVALLAATERLIAA